MALSRVTVNGWRQESGSLSSVTVNGWRQETSPATQPPTVPLIARQYGPDGQRPMTILRM